MTTPSLAFGDGVTWRRSKRGLVVSSVNGPPLLIEHPRAADLPDLLGEITHRSDLVTALGGLAADDTLVDDLLAEGVLRSGTEATSSPPPQPKRLTFTRSGVEFTGIAGVARWVHRFTVPVLRSITGRLVLVGIVVAGVAALVSGRPAGPTVSAHPWIDATLGLCLGLMLAALHELAHAVALVHYGRTPKRAGMGFYWGALSFYVDSSDGITLPRRARIINALAGIAVDLVTTCLLLVVSHAAASCTLLMAVCWRVTILQILTIIEGGLPVLENDGHLALADYFDEPDLAPRSREALTRILRRITRDDDPPWLATYGAVSWVVGVALLIASTWIWWLAAGDLLLALFDGNPAEIALGLYVVAPVALGVMFSLLGFVLELTSKPPDIRPAAS